MTPSPRFTNFFLTFLDVAPDIPHHRPSLLSLAPSSRHGAGTPCPPRTSDWPGMFGGYWPVFCRKISDKELPQEETSANGMIPMVQPPTPHLEHDVSSFSVVLSSLSRCGLIIFGQHPTLVGGWAYPSEKYELFSWEYYSQYKWTKIPNMFQTTKQFWSTSNLSVITHPILVATWLTQWPDPSSHMDTHVDTNFYGALEFISIRIRSETPHLVTFLLPKWTNSSSMTKQGFWRVWLGRKVNMRQLKVWDNQIFGGLISNITAKKLQVHPKKDTKKKIYDNYQVNPLNPELLLFLLMFFLTSHWLNPADLRKKHHGRTIICLATLLHLHQHFGVLDLQLADVAPPWLRWRACWKPWWVLPTRLDHLHSCLWTAG